MSHPSTSTEPERAPVELAARKSRPARIVVTALPQEPVTRWTYDKVNRALDAHEIGNFELSAPLADAFGRDDRITACLNTRLEAIIGRHGAEFSIEPSDRGDKRRAKVAAKDVESWWYDFVPEKAARRILRDKILLGVSISRVEWVARDGQWYPRPRPWPMQFVYWDDSRQCFMAMAREGVFEVRAEDPNWLICAMTEEQPWMDGALRSLGLPFLLRSFDWRDWARFNERHGMPIIAIKEPAEADEDAKESFFESMKKMGRGGVVRLPQMTDGLSGQRNGYEVDFIEAKSTSWETFKAFGERLEVAVAVRLLGQNLTTEVQGGSRAAASVHDRVRQDYMDADAEGLSTDLRDGLLKPWVRYCYPPSVGVDIAPWPCWNTDAPEDRTQLAATGVKAGAAIKQFQALGLRVDLEAYLERLGIPMLPGEPIEEPEEPPTERTEPPAPEPSDGDEDQDDDDDQASTQARLASGDALSGARGFADGQDYADRLAARSAQRGSEALAPDLEALIALIESSESRGELEQKLLASYKTMDHAARAKIIERALILAELAGRHAVLEDL